MYFNGDEDELYNISKDKEELHNILSQHPEKAEELKKSLVAELAKSYNDLPAPPEKFKAEVERRISK